MKDAILSALQLPQRGPRNRVLLWKNDPILPFGGVQNARLFHLLLRRPPEIIDHLLRFAAMPLLYILYILSALKRVGRYICGEGFHGSTRVQSVTSLWQPLADALPSCRTAYLRPLQAQKYLIPRASQAALRAGAFSPRERYVSFGSAPFPTASAKAVVPMSPI